MEHYRCMKCFIPSTRQERIADTVQFFPNKIRFPTTSLNEYLMYALDKISTILQSSDFHKLNNKLHLDNQTLHALEFITTLLQKMTQVDSPEDKPSSVQTPIPSTSASSSTKSTVPSIPTLPAVPAFQATTLPSATCLNLSSTTHAELPRVKLLKKLQVICHRHLANRTARNAQQILLHKVMHIYDSNTGKKLTLRALLQNPGTTATWSKSASNEYGRLLDGNQYGIKGTKTMQMIHPAKIPTTKKITYATMVCDYRPLKSEKHRCRLVVGGDKLPYTADAAAPAANLLETKLLLNSTISQPTARFMSIDISNFFLSSTIPEPEFMKIH